MLVHVFTCHVYLPSDSQTHTRLASTVVWSQPEERNKGRNVPWWHTASAVSLRVCFTVSAKEREVLSSPWHVGESVKEGKEGRKQGSPTLESPLGKRLETTPFALVLLLDVSEAILVSHGPASSHPYVPSWLPSNQEPLLLARGWEVWKEELPSFYLPASVPQSPRPVCPSWLMGGTASPSIRNELISSTYALVFYYMGVSQVSHLLTSCLLPVFELWVQML